MILASLELFRPEFDVKMVTMDQNCVVTLKMNVLRIFCKVISPKFNWTPIIYKLKLSTRWKPGHSRIYTCSQGTVGIYGRGFPSLTAKVSCSCTVINSPPAMSCDCVAGHWLITLNQGGCYKALTPSKSMLIAWWTPCHIIIIDGTENVCKYLVYLWCICNDIHFLDIYFFMFCSVYIQKALLHSIRFG